MSYRIEPLTKEEYATLRWLSSHGYDADILQIAGVEEHHEDGGVTLGVLSENRAWKIMDNIEEDPHAFLANNGSRSLGRKLREFIESIV